MVVVVKAAGLVVVAVKTVELVARAAKAATTVLAVRAVVAAVTAALLWASTTPTQHLARFHLMST